MDGIDVAVADLRIDPGSDGGTEAGTIVLSPLGHTELSYPESLRARLFAALPPAACSARDLCVLDTEVGRCFADAAQRGIDEFGDGRADLVSSLGQTLYHWVEDGQARGTLQVGQPAWIAEATGLPVVSDLRARDVAAGGHGAPLAGVLDALWLAGEPGTNAALNIGGIANITVIGGTRSFAYDTGPGNALIDVAASMVFDKPGAQDTDGALAARGTVQPDLLGALLAESYYERPASKSTGKERFNRDYLRRKLADHDTVGDADLLATLTELTAVTISNACRAHGVDRVVASGGGVSNPALMTALRRRLHHDGAELILSDELGLPSAGKEALLAALLGFRTVHGLTGTVPGATGAAGPRLLGSITPGHQPWQPPDPSPVAVRRLRVHG